MPFGQPGAKQMLRERKREKTAKRGIRAIC